MIQKVVAERDINRSDLSDRTVSVISAWRDLEIILNYILGSVYLHKFFKWKELEEGQKSESHYVKHGLCTCCQVCVTVAKIKRTLGS